MTQLEVIKAELPEQSCAVEKEVEVAAEESPAEEEGGDDQQCPKPFTPLWDPSRFEGEFLDTLGNIVTVAKTANARLSFTASLGKPGSPQVTHLTISKRWPSNHSVYKSWMCGNGVLQRKKSSFEKIIWRRYDGKESIWERRIPDGIVYFDPPQFLTNMNHFFPVTYAMDPDEEEAPQQVPEIKEKVEYVPRLDSPSNNVAIEDGMLEWTVCDKYAKFAKMPKDFAINSPVFSVHDIENMQLIFLPKGRKKQLDDGLCAINIVMGTLRSGTGVKFEIFLNGVSGGPRVCLGKRYDVEYQQLDVQEVSTVKISLRILDIFREESILN
jgi:hypothetical protein